jgi:hypothetical protein
MFSEGRTNAHDDDRNGRPSLVTADLLEGSRKQKIYHLHRLKRFLAEDGFSSADGLKTAMQHWVKTLAANFFDDGIEKLVPRYDRCLSLDGDYVEN